jgi:hypothetical protein
MWIKVSLLSVIGLAAVLIISPTPSEAFGRHSGNAFGFRGYSSGGGGGGTWTTTLQHEPVY